MLNLVELLCLAILSKPRKGGKTEGKSSIPRGTAWCNCLGRVLSTNGGVGACECAEALGKVSASPFWSVRNKKPRKVIPVIPQRPLFFHLDSARSTVPGQSAVAWAIGSPADAGTIRAGRSTGDRITRRSYHSRRCLKRLPERFPGPGSGLRKPPGPPTGGSAPRRCRPAASHPGKARHERWRPAE